MWPLTEKNMINASFKVCPYNIQNIWLTLYGKDETSTKVLSTIIWFYLPHAVKITGFDTPKEKSRALLL